jgi:hypothetical protein
LLLFLSDLRRGFAPEEIIVQGPLIFVVSTVDSKIKSWPISRKEIAELAPKIHNSRLVAFTTARTVLFQESVKGLAAVWKSVCNRFFY